MATIHVRPHPWEMDESLYPIAARRGKTIRYRLPSAYSTGPGSSAGAVAGPNHGGANSHCNSPAPLPGGSSHPMHTTEGLASFIRAFFAPISRAAYCRSGMIAL